MALHFNARDLVQMSKPDLWALPDDQVIIDFDDGRVVTNTRPTIYCAYIWKIHRHYPSLPLRTVHHLGERRFSLKLHLEIFSQVYRDWINTYINDYSVSLDAFWKLVYEVTNEIENDFKLLLEANVPTLNITDFLEMIQHPQVQNANWECAPTQSSIDNCYYEIDRVLQEDRQVSNNPIAFVRRSEIVDRKQIMQCIGPRGFCTDINSEIFRKPVMYGFAHGLRSLFDAMAESRSATKALVYQTGSALSNSQYFNREMQLLGQNVRDIAEGDCGSRHTVDFHIKASQIENLKGIYYYDTNGQLRMIEGDKELDADIIDTVVPIRTPFGCIHPDRQTVCSVCFGALSYSIPKRTNPGHISAIALGEVISQLVLSTKHVEGSSEVDSIELAETYQAYLTPTSDNLSLRIADDLLERVMGEDGRILPGRLAVELNAQEAEKVPEVVKRGNFYSFSPQEITAMVAVDLIIFDEDGEIEESVRVPISKGTRLGSLSYELLNHIAHFGYEITDRDKYRFDLGHWSSFQPVFVLPLRHTSMTVFQQEVKDFLFSKRGAEKKKRSSPKDLWDYDNVAQAMEDFHDFVTSKIPKFNFSHIMMLTYMMAARDPDNGDYRLPRGGESFLICTHSHMTNPRELLFSRSMGMLMSYESQHNGPSGVRPYVQREGRPSHPSDEVLIPDDS